MNIDYSLFMKISQNIVTDKRKSPKDQLITAYIIQRLEQINAKYANLNYGNVIKLCNGDPLKVKSIDIEFDVVSKDEIEETLIDFEKNIEETLKKIDLNLENYKPTIKHYDDMLSEITKSMNEYEMSNVINRTTNNQSGISCCIKQNESFNAKILVKFNEYDGVAYKIDINNLCRLDEIVDKLKEDLVINYMNNIRVLFYSNRYRMTYDDMNYFFSELLTILKNKKDLELVKNALCIFNEIINFPYDIEFKYKHEFQSLINTIVN